MPGQTNPGGYTQSVSEKTGEFHAHRPGSEPMTKKDHKPGNQVGNDAVPEFHAQTLPPGSAPKDRTFQPDPSGEYPFQDNAEGTTSAQDTIHGATSADVHTGIGKPINGMTSQEIRGDGSKGSREKNGLARVGAGEYFFFDFWGSEVVLIEGVTDPNDSFRERALDTDFPAGTKGKSGENRGEEIDGAEERPPETAERVAAERAG
ncbi:phosphatidylinositol n-acetylglucosaminyltransferase gpi3 subunit protein [Rutstroemia sp. NJR-2017a WRK4]|nr:phosphatidylinositol n-acetylglucosaminyltransferase gpi3 subunit protein [Rutstroemia sp. NJR-2017a WRK4]